MKYANVSKIVSESLWKRKEGRSVSPALYLKENMSCFIVKQFWSLHHRIQVKEERQQDEKRQW